MSNDFKLDLQPQDKLIIEKRNYDIAKAAFEKETTCCPFCKQEVPKKDMLAFPAYSYDDHSINMTILCEEDHKKLIRRLKYKWFYAVVDFCKSIFRGRK